MQVVVSSRSQDVGAVADVGADATVPAPATVLDVSDPRQRRLIECFLEAFAFNLDHANADALLADLGGRIDFAGARGWNAYRIIHRTPQVGV